MSSTLMIAAVRTSEMSVYFNETTWSYIPESCHLHTRRRQNLNITNSLAVFELQFFLSSAS
jgi:hypothetical protein